MATKGYVYILEVKDLTLPVCKIGFTRQYPIERCAEINKSSTGDLLWSVSSWVIVDDPERLGKGRKTILMSPLTKLLPPFGR